MMYYWPDGRAPQAASDTAWAAFAKALHAAAAERQDDPADDPAS